MVGTNEDVAVSVVTVGVLHGLGDAHDRAPLAVAVGTRHVAPCDFVKDS
jgi:hypothetical protein